MPTKMLETWLLDPSLSISPAAFVGWFDKIKEQFSDFKPETRTMMINFTRKTSTIGFQVSVPDGWRKNTNKVKIPTYPGFNIIRMMDESFHEQKNLWRHQDGFHVLDAKDLPTSEKYLIEMEGSIDENALKNLVHIKPAANRDNDDEDDKYWLDSSIKTPKALEKIYDDLEIEEVNVGVYVDIDKMFGLTLPKEIRTKAESLHRLLDESKKFNRNEILRSAAEYKRQERLHPSYNPGDFIKIIQRLTARDIVGQHIEIDKPYNVGNIDQPEKFVGIVPQNIKVQALTTLTLRNPAALGYLKFKRKMYMDKLKSEFDKFG